MLAFWVLFHKVAQRITHNVLSASLPLALWCFESCSLQGTGPYQCGFWRVACGFQLGMQLGVSRPQESLDSACWSVSIRLCQITNRLGRLSRKLGKQESIALYHKKQFFFRTPKGWGSFKASITIPGFIAADLNPSTKRHSQSHMFRRKVYLYSQTHTHTPLHLQQCLVFFMES